MFKFREGEKKNTASPVTLLVPVVQDTIIPACSCFVLAFFVTYVPLQLWVAIGMKINHRDT